MPHAVDAVKDRGDVDAVAPAWAGAIETGTGARRVAGGDGDTQAAKWVPIRRRDPGWAGGACPSDNDTAGWAGPLAPQGADHDPSDSPDGDEDR